MFKKYLIGYLAADLFITLKIKELQQSQDIKKYILEIENNISLITTRFLSTNNFFHSFTSRILQRCFVSNRCSESSHVFPLCIKEDQSVFKDLIKENFKIPFRKFINTKYSKKSLRKKGFRGGLFIQIKLKNRALEEYKDS